MTTSLITRLEEAAEGSRELDARIWMALNDPEPANYFAGVGMEMWFDGTPREVLSTSSGLSATHELKPAMGKVTTSLDAALALAERVLPRWGFDCGQPARMGEHGGRPWADCWPPVEDGEVVAFKLGGPRPTHRHSNAATPALALCTAILKAVQHGD